MYNCTPRRLKKLNLEKNIYLLIFLFSVDVVLREIAVVLNVLVYSFNTVGDLDLIAPLNFLQVRSHDHRCVVASRRR